MKVKWFMKVSWLLIEHVFDLIVDTGIAYVRIIHSNLELFLGSALTIIGLLNFANGKNCDGNTADYLSCTHPSTFYYYGGLEITFIVLGVLLVLISVQKHHGKK